MLKMHNEKKQQEIFFGMNEIISHFYVVMNMV